jgi:hypothetical protein
MSTMKKYIAPIKRKQLIQEEGLSKEELTSEKMFPTLCTTSNTPWQQKTFKATIDALIASEKLTAQEKAARMEAKKAMEGWVRLSLNLSKEDCIRFNTMTETNARIAKEMEDPWYYKPGSNTIYKSYDKEDDSVSIQSEHGDIYDTYDDEELKADDS